MRDDHDDWTACQREDNLGGQVCGGAPRKTIQRGQHHHHDQQDDGKAGEDLIFHVDLKLYRSR